MDSAIDGILSGLLPEPYHVIVRPHPQYVRHYGAKLNALEEKYSSYSNFELQTDFSSNETVFNADVLVTDWSGIAYEYSFTTLKPCLFINTPMKIMNPEYEKIGIVPFNVRVRETVGAALKPEEMNRIPETVQSLLERAPEYASVIREEADRNVYHRGESAEIGARRIIDEVFRQTEKRRGTAEN